MRTLGVADDRLVLTSNPQCSLFRNAGSDDTVVLDWARRCTHPRERHDEAAFASPWQFPMTSRAPDIETIVIGGGVIGMAIAVACAKAGQSTAVIERNSGCGQEITSRSSEVIHAGLYYPAGSLKALHCVAGKSRLYQFANENGVAVKRLGKLIVATSHSELPALADIAAKAKVNGVDDLQVLSPAQVHALEPEVACVGGLFSPSTGIIDSHALVQSLEGHLSTSAGTVIFKTSVTAIKWHRDSHFELDVLTSGTPAKVSARNVIVAAGLGMAELRSVLPHAPGYVAPDIQFAKGHYFTYQRRTPFQHLVYPVPVAGGLGIHLTLDLQGQARFGPDVAWIENIDYSFDDVEGARRAEFERAVRTYWPGISASSLVQGYVGIRPKTSKAGAPARDFEIHGPREHGIPRMVALYGIESPGLTACLSLADYCCGMIA